MTFEDLESWQQARQLTKQIYSVSREDGIARDFGLCSQIQRAGVSAMSNLAEGFERRHVMPSGDVLRVRSTQVNHAPAGVQRQQFAFNRGSPLSDLCD